MPANDRKVSIARLSIYDDIDGVILGDAIQRNATVSPQSIQALVERRTAGVDPVASCTAPNGLPPATDRHR